jgi:cell shape-determining protein MreD
VTPKLRRWARDPVVWTGALQIVKTVVAAVAAWAIAVHVFDLPQPFLAPWAALLTVHATVYSTFRRGVQQVGATVLGVLLAFVAGSLFGVNAATLGAMLLVALLAGSWRGLRDESTTAAATGLVVLLTGYADDGGMLAARLADTAIGIGVGVLVNLIVWAPLRHRSAARHVDVIDDRIGALLTEMAEAIEGGCTAEEVDGWITRTRELDGDIDDAWAITRQAWESGRYNPRHAARARTEVPAGFEVILLRLEQAVAESRSMARTLHRLCDGEDRWHRGFRDRWAALLLATGHAVTAADHAALADVRAGLGELREEAFEADLPVEFWAVAGALMVNLRNIVAALGLVADAQPVSLESRRDRAPVAPEVRERTRRPMASAR